MLRVIEKAADELKDVAFLGAPAARHHRHRVARVLTPGGPLDRGAHVLGLGTDGERELSAVLTAFDSRGDEGDQGRHRGDGVGLLPGGATALRHGAADGDLERRRRLVDEAPQRIPPLAGEEAVGVVSRGQGGGPHAQTVG